MKWGQSLVILVQCEPAATAQHVLRGLQDIWKNMEDTNVNKNRRD